jgi:hypothetical protein
MKLPEEDIENNVYSKKARSKLVDNGELSNEEAGFMEGYDLEEEEIDEEQ